MIQHSQPLNPRKSILLLLLFLFSVFLISFMGIVHGLFILFIIFPIFTSSNPETEALLRLKSSFTNSTSLDSWSPGTEPCAGKWVGVVCEGGVVSGLRLGKLGLSGNIDVDALASLPGLRSVAFTFNSFSGSIPKFHAAAALKGLFLTGNQFSGEIPSDFFLKMEGLKKIWLSTNNFSGPIPSSLTRLSQLMELHLENNHFSGLIPPFEQQSLVAINLSGNNLEGQVPAALLRFTPDAFRGNAKLCGVNSPCDHDHHLHLHHPSSTTKPRRKSHTSDALMMVFFILTVCAALILFMLAVLFLARKRRRGAKGNDDETVKQNVETPLTSGASGKKLVSSSKNGFGSSIYGRMGRGDGLVFINEEMGSFGMSDMMRAASEVMRGGALGTSFKTTMASGAVVVVKRVRALNAVGRGEFDEKVRRLGSLRHKNLLPLLAYHNGKEEKLLVFEYQHHGSLLLHLHDDQGVSASTDLNWPLRLKIIQGIVRGLEFLHSQLPSSELPHGDLKSSNVLLSEDYEPLLADYGMWALISEGEAAETLMAFKAPEAMKKGCISPKCDVYFLGVVILEILARKFPSQYLSNGQGGTDLVEWARSAVGEGREAELLDPEVADAAESVEQMKQLVHIALSCTRDEPDERLGLREAVCRIQGLEL